MQAGDQLVLIPAGILGTLDHPSLKRWDILGDGANATVHSRLATAFTACELSAVAENKSKERVGCTGKIFPEWQAVWPKITDVSRGMSLMWTSGQQSLLPPAAKKMLDHQKRKFDEDWRIAFQYLDEYQDGMKNIKDVYTYHWLIVNTRTFYWDEASTSKVKKRRPGHHKHYRTPTADDHMCLCPFGDYFNHQDQGGSGGADSRLPCDVTFSSEGFTITARRDYNPGEEVFVSYGAHSNDFLLVEYGFVMDDNRDDRIELDPVFMDLLKDKAIKSALEERGYFRYDFAPFSSP